jgi:wyosine [tRNA(Phe)-imidazoG37] synthetase (radical SAM superfamily)
MSGRQLVATKRSTTVSFFLFFLKNGSSRKKINEIEKQNKKDIQYSTVHGMNEKKNQYINRPKKQKRYTRNE